MGRIWRGKVLLGNISPKKDLVTRFAYDSPCVILDAILCDFCFDIFLSGFMRAIQGAAGGGWPGRKSSVQLPGEERGWHTVRTSPGCFVTTHVPGSDA